eukprot:scaffold128501_cov24-Phaeocystis_antarctica.AAC.1
MRGSAGGPVGRTKGLETTHKPNRHIDLVASRRQRRRWTSAAAAASGWSTGGKASPARDGGGTS